SYGVGAALTLDEFALWLNLEDVYWAHAGRLSIDAVVVFGSLLAVGAWGAPFFRGLQRMWSSRSLLPGKLVAPIRRARLLRPRRFLRLPLRIGPSSPAASASLTARALASPASILLPPREIASAIRSPPGCCSPRA